MRLGRKAQLLRHVGLDARIDAGECSDGAGNGAGRNLRPRGLQAGAVAGEFGIVPGKLDAEGRGLGMDGVAAADAERKFVLAGLRLQCGEKPVNVRQKNVAGARELHRQAGVEHVGGGQALVDDPRFRSDMLGKIGKEPGLRQPDGRHFGASIAFDHGPDPRRGHCPRQGYPVSRTGASVPVRI